jgi:hypothetical protein
VPPAPSSPSSAWRRDAAWLRGRDPAGPIHGD